jgi:hypothetical protein
VFAINDNCLLCGAKTNSGTNRCDDCISLGEYVDSLFQDAKEALANNPSIDREPVFKTLREFAFTVQEDSLLRTYKNAMKFFLEQFVDRRNTETKLEFFMKKVPTRLNQLKILSELSESRIVNWDPTSISKETSPKIYPGEVLINLKNSYERTTVTERAEQRYGHAITFYSILPLLKEYSQCVSKDEIKKLNLVPKKPWVILLTILIGNDDGKISLAKTNKFLKKRRGVGNIYGTIITNLNSLSTDYTQKATVDVEDNGNNDKVYLISPDIVQYLKRIRENIRSRQL